MKNYIFLMTLTLLTVFSSSLYGLGTVNVKNLTNKTLFYTWRSGDFFGTGKSAIKEDYQRLTPKNNKTDSNWGLATIIEVYALPGEGKIKPNVRKDVKSAAHVVEIKEDAKGNIVIEPH